MTTTSLPSADELATAARHATTACGVRAESLGGDHAIHSPVNGAELATVSWSDAGDVDAAVQRATVAFKGVARRPGAGARPGRTTVCRVTA